jgi:hypothetical protein
MEKKPTLDEFYKRLASALPGITYNYCKVIYIREFGEPIEENKNKNTQENKPSKKSKK